MEERFVAENEKVMTVKDWLICQILMIIPIVNIIMVIKWLVCKNTNVNLKNLIISSIIMIFLGILIYGVLGVLLLGMLSSVTIH